VDADSTPPTASAKIACLNRITTSTFLFWYRTANRAGAKRRPLPQGNQSFSTSRDSTENSGWPKEPSSHMYRETRHPEHPGADGVLGVNTSWLANIRFSVRTVTLEFFYKRSFHLRRCWSTYAPTNSGYAQHQCKWFCFLTSHDI
jgi:hypothetical protein